MILSASRRTDIPCYYSEWFMNRIRAGYVLTRNPMNHAQLSKIPLSPDIAKCNSQQEYEMFKGSGFFTITRENSENDTKNEVLTVLEKHFRL